MLADSKIADIKMADAGAVQQVKATADIPPLEKYPAPVPMNAECKASANGNFAELKRLVAADPDFLQVYKVDDGDSGNTPLIYAVDGGHFECVKFLLSVTETGV